MEFGEWCLITSSQSRIDEYTRQGTWGKTTMHDLLWLQVEVRGEQLAVADQPNRSDFTDGQVQRLSFAQLDAAATCLAVELLDRGIRSGDTLLVQLPNIAELVVVYLAASLIGAIVSPLPVQYGPHELKTAAAAVSPAVVITVERMKETSLAATARSALSGAIPVLCFCDQADATANLHLAACADEQARERIRAHHAAHPPDANAILTICWTSGTTGTPKGVPRSHNMWLALARTSSEAGQYRAGDRLLNPFPMVNMASLGGSVLPFLLHGCTLVLHHPFDAKVFLQQVQDERITFTLVPPALLNQLAKNAELWNRYDFSALRRVGSGAAPLSPWMVRTFDEKYGKPIVNFYGSNEGIALFSTPESAPEPEVRALMFPRLGCAGMPWSGIGHQTVRNKVVRQDTGEEITAPGVSGELLFGGPTVFDGYLGRANDDVFTAGGWFRTGDLVEICGEPPNYYRIVGRCKDIINRGGMKISPAELDILLEAFPGAAEGAVCGYPDETLGERVCACVVPMAGQVAPQLEEINAFLLDKGVARFKLPERLLVLEKLPRNPLGKIQRHELEQRVSAA